MLSLSLTHRQLDQVTRAAAMVPPSDRDAFLRSVAARLELLRSYRGTTDGDVAHALSYVLGERGVATGLHTFLVQSLREQLNGSRNQIRRRQRSV